MDYTRGEWKASFNPGVTGPTTPAIPPVCGGQNWPYRTINVGMETIAIVPAQACDHIVGQASKPIKGSDEANAHLIAAAVNACQSVNPDNPLAVAESIKDMYEALNGILLVAQPCDGAKFEFEKTYCGVFKVHGNRLEDVVKALAKAEERPTQ